MFCVLARSYTLQNIIGIYYTCIIHIIAASVVFSQKLIFGLRWYVPRANIVRIYSIIGINHNNMYYNSNATSHRLCEKTCAVAAMTSWRALVGACLIACSFYPNLMDIMKDTQNSYFVDNISIWCIELLLLYTSCRCEYWPALANLKYVT